jgi:hypothetical protein
MYHSEKISPEIIRKLTENEDRGDLYKIGAGSRIVRARQCDHCGESYYPRRKNQKYCSGSCRVLACYKRKNYKYKSGRYQKDEEKSLAPVQAIIPSIIPTTEKPKPSFDWSNFGESAAASATVETAKYLIHDKPMMDKIDKMLNILSGKNLGGNLKYKGVQMLNGNPIGLFQDDHGFTVINTHDGRWFKIVSNNPMKLQAMTSPFK